MPTSKTPAAIFVATLHFSTFSKRAEIPSPKTQKKYTLKQRSPKTNQKYPSNSHYIPTIFKEMEAVIMVDVLRRADAAVTVASVEQQLEGGMPGSARLRDCKVLLHITSKQAEGKQLYGAIFAAPAVTLLPWGLLRRKQSTCHPAVMDKLPTVWAVKSNLHIFGELTTSQGPGTCFEFTVSLVEQLYGKSVAKDICDLMLLNVADDDSRNEEFNEVSWSLDHAPQIFYDEQNKCCSWFSGKSLQIFWDPVEQKIVADMMISAAAESIYDLIILPSKILKKLLKEQELAGRIFGAICSSPAFLQRQGLLKDKRATAHPSVISMLNGAVNGARAEVVIDCKVIASKGLDTATNFYTCYLKQAFWASKSEECGGGSCFWVPLVIGRLSSPVPIKNFRRAFSQPQINEEK
ncbi:hypothetical protein Pfo_002642 [Paulownia fortunei]|nr:hypothetical protein Pfo_002642 [Paulownia fortunei]